MSRVTMYVRSLRLFRKLSAHQMRIVPTILTDNFSELKKLIRKAEGFCNYVQIDIMDGRFTSSKSIEVSDLSKVKTNLGMEVHLMVENPLEFLGGLKKIKNIKKIFFHFEADAEPKETIKRISDLKLKGGLAINPETKIKEIKELLNLVDSVLILSVTPGFYGSKFLPQTLKKIRQIRKINSRIEIGLDGGIKLKNISKVIKYPLDFLCIGSAILKEEDPKNAFLEFKRIAK